MSEGGTELPAKHLVAEALLDDGGLFVHFDPRVPGVVAPARFKAQPQLVFQFGRGLTIPIPDLLVDVEGISGTLSFQRTPHACFVPWDAVFALVGDDGRGMVFPDSMPGEIRAEIDLEAARRAARPVAEGPSSSASGDPSEETPEETSAPDNVIHVAFGKKTPPGGPRGGPPAPPRRPPTLKRIK
jgi:stringent starvation protein B